ncbi:citrate lyase subunit beta / citryl-CoA lyase [Halorientalis regularis]|uniref:Citrate lyase subunit beta / citryl-CoA lyase n=1 Tax=Halorientalis regularis TaxID=660518 RepID=A0A1G7S8A3_9EURY|nr:citrate lyase subunit beta / citryl-CoA lyase [Halorientalis regularis]
MNRRTANHNIPTLGKPRCLRRGGCHARERVVVAASAAGIDAIGTIYPDYGDQEGFREATEFAAQLGYDGKMAIHPDQVPVINDAFTPSDEEIE